MSTTTNWAPGPRIYNLFPLLAGPLPEWTPHLERVQRLGFNWVFINSFHFSGYSGSLYSIKDYYALDPRLLDPAAGPPLTQLEQMIQTAKRLGYSRYFLDQPTAVEDDHLPFVNAGVSAADVIDLDYGPGNNYHHTTKDTVDKCSPASMAIVGRVVTATLEELENSLRAKH